jgi:glycine/D-amino acid oxidase-like deaminating enzyme
METVTVRQVRQLSERIRTTVEQGGPAAPEAVRLELQTMDRRCTFSTAARALFQDLLGRWGVATPHSIGLPLNDEPFWFRSGRPLADYHSRPELPDSADVVVVGAGLTGASAAYHLAHEGGSGLRVVVLDQGDPAGEASGRNGGNFELFPENSVGVYEGLARERVAFLRRRYPGLPAEVVQAESERQASLVLGVSLRNRDLLKSIILREHIDCDFAPRGWLHLASNEVEEQGLCEEVMLAAQHGQRIEIWSRRKIREEFGFENAYLGRFIPGDGTFHPFKYACGLLRCALRAGVELYTRVRACEVAWMGPDEHHVVTARGTITARRVIVATNAFTSQLFPELRAIRAYQSQVQVTEYAADRTRGRVVTCEDGPAFFNQPREGAHDGQAPLLMGGGADRPMGRPSSRRRSLRVHAQLLALRDRFFPELRGRPPSSEWIGPMAFTPDQLPAIGFLRPGVVVAAGYNGYGGSYTTAAGLAAARMALTGSVPDWVPEDVFSPRRLLSAAPIFMTERDGLWRIATSLCRQLKVVNDQLTEALTLRSSLAVPNRRRADPPRVSRMMRAGALDTAPGATIDPELLTALPGFRDFTSAELRHLLQATTRWDLPRGRLVFREGDAGGTCFIVVRGLVDVSIKVRGHPRLLGQLGAGTMFGQVSLIEGEPRTTSCSIRRDAVLAQLERDACERLLRGRVAVALKFLALLNRGLIAALRSADRQLMQLNGEGRGEWSGAGVTP